MKPDDTLHAKLEAYLDARCKSLEDKLDSLADDDPRYDELNGRVSELARLGNELRPGGKLA